MGTGTLLTFPMSWNGISMGSNEFRRDLNND